MGQYLRKCALASFCVRMFCEVNGHSSGAYGLTVSLSKDEARISSFLAAC